MQRVAIFAHYDKDNLIEDYVIYYLQELKKVADKIIFVSDSNISESELQKINNIIDNSIIGKHGEYDFGSYKRGYSLAKKLSFLDDCYELIICNDSCYGPLFQFDNLFETMSVKNLDFWGLTMNPIGKISTGNDIKEIELPHLQSYFIVFKPQVFTSNIFDNFITSVKKESTKDLIIIKYEEELTTLLSKNNFKYDVYCEHSKKIQNAHVRAYENLITEDKCPLVKTSIYRETQRPKYPPNYKILKKYTNYDITLIKKDIKRNKKPFTFKNFLQYIFSINNTYTHKTIIICGIVIKIKRKSKTNV